MNTSDSGNRLHKKGNRLHSATATVDGDKIAAWLRNAWPQHTAKYAAQVTGACERTVKGWLNGQVPKPDYLARLMAHFGPGFAAMAFTGVQWLTEVEMERQLTEAESRLSELRAQREALQA
jgi:hypothetical protein